MYGRTSLRVYDLIGREVATLADDLFEAGTHSVRFNGADLATGVYICELRAGGYVASRKILLMK
jgi:hypothetical protein